MAFMIPEYTNEPFAVLTDEHGESLSVPLDCVNLQDGYEVEETISGKWWYRLTAPGYMDCTEWSGPYDDEEAARTALSEENDVDPDTGDDLPED